MAYIEAIVAYREIMRRTLKMFLDEYRSELRPLLGVSSLAPLLDVHDPRFLTHRLAAQFASRNRSRNSAGIIDWMHKQLKNDAALNRFASALRDSGDQALANDLPFFIEYRLRLARTHAIANIQVVPVEANVASAAHA